MKLAEDWQKKRLNLITGLYYDSRRELTPDQRREKAIKQKSKYEGGLHKQ